MKKIYVILCVFIGLLMTTIVDAQSNVTSSGISIQGIARDETNAALANIDQLDLVFTVYYLGSGNIEQNIITKTASVKTDNFGVFSYVLSLDQTLFSLISTQSAYLKVVQGSTVFSNEKLQTVPYAIYAQNGVPTGSIMAFIGSVAPNGWLLCDGSAFTDNASNANLKALLNSTTTPNLKAMFLRGAGDGNSKVGPALKAVQPEDTKSHLHSMNFNTSTNGNHNHNTGFANDDYNGSGGSNKNGLEDDTSLNNNRTLPTDYAGDHQHNINGNTDATGGTETRPINYGVNYIIKI